MPWIIDTDHNPDEKAPAGTNLNAAGVMGPFGYKGDGSELTHKFRMLTDDRDLMYEGRSHGASSFAPLEDFGTPNAGCTIIQYKVNGAWEDL